MGAYICERCQNVFNSYSRICPICQAEKCMIFKQNHKLETLLLNIVSCLTKEDLDEFLEGAGIDKLDHNTLFEYIREVCK